jgi:hypothetical protein
MEPSLRNHPSRSEAGASCSSYCFIEEEILEVVLQSDGSMLTTKLVIEDLCRRLMDRKVGMSTVPWLVARLTTHEFDTSEASHPMIKKQYQRRILDKQNNSPKYLVIL